MKFTRPINREVEIAGNTFIVSMDESGIGFRLKGKRRVARLDWNEAFEIARGEQGASARDFLGLADQPFERASQESATEIDAHREMPLSQFEEEYQPQSQDTTSSADDDMRRSITAQAGTEQG
jgi:hypothetical protein